MLLFLYLVTFQCISFFAFLSCFVPVLAGQRLVSLSNDTVLCSDCLIVRSGDNHLLGLFSPWDPAPATNKKHRVAFAHDRQSFSQLDVTISERLSTSPVPSALTIFNRHSERRQAAQYAKDQPYVLSSKIGHYVSCGPRDPRVSERGHCTYLVCTRGTLCQILHAEIYYVVLLILWGVPYSCPY
ncbi:hypothetical protein BDV39DRAFT_80065 [Aspergillus sergii]|uniref:Uncharacterized protein n=1 Tax=Aspergillus sergii TaxID=1034303 RepID=A0A5N6X375_9EURO|nr:hypothetical protein BDV39DRAFT_80065 [Aspergillus sergii]